MRGRPVEELKESTEKKQGWSGGRKGSKEGRNEKRHTTAVKLLNLCYILHIYYILQPLTGLGE